MTADYARRPDAIRFSKGYLILGVMPASSLILNHNPSFGNAFHLFPWVDSQILN
jgi:hypothetical protein